MKYVILDENKRPTHTFKNGVGAKEWEDAKDYPNIALIVPYPVIILDFDTVEDARIMLKIVDELNLKCRVMKTTRGYHFWFKSVEPWKCFVKQRLSCGIYCDCKSHSKNAYVKIKDKGVMREFIRECDLDDLQEVPVFLKPLNAPEKFHFQSLQEGQGRNAAMYSYILYLQSKRYARDEILACLNVINDFVLKDPLEKSELETICRDGAFKPKEELKSSYLNEEGKFSHTMLGDDLIELYHIKTVNGIMYVYQDDYYQPGGQLVELKMFDLFQDIRQSQRTEVLSYIKLKTNLEKSDLKRNPYLLNCKNTLIDIRTGEQFESSPDLVQFDRIPVIYNPYASCQELDRMLSKVFCDDRTVKDLFEEMVGYCFIRHNDYQKAFMLYGTGSNGKSTILELIKNLLGQDNYSSIELNHLSDRFTTAELENKLANIGDDINAYAMRDTGTLKKLFSGDELIVERKCQAPYNLKPYATMIFSCNEIPKSFDKTEGLYRRWVFIPFEAKFSRYDIDYDPMIKDKILTEEAMSHFLNLALKGARRLIANGGFTEPERVSELIQQYRVDNSNVLTWIDDAEITEGYLLKNPTDQLYNEFKDWCKNSSVKKITGKMKFNKELIERFNFNETKTQRQEGGVRKRYFDLQSID